MAERISKRGGVREGAGRKPVGKESRSTTLAVRLTPESKLALAQEAERQQVSIATLIERFAERIKEGGC